MAKVACHIQILRHAEMQVFKQSRVLLGASLAGKHILYLCRKTQLIMSCVITGALGNFETTWDDSTNHCISLLILHKHITTIMPAIRSLQCSAPINSGIQRSAKGPRFQHHSAAMLHVETVEGHLENSHHLSCIDRAQRMMISGSWKRSIFPYTYTQSRPEASCTKEIHSTQVNIFVFFSFYNITCVRVYGGYLSFSLSTTMQWELRNPGSRPKRTWWVWLKPWLHPLLEKTSQPHATIQQDVIKLSPQTNGQLRDIAFLSPFKRCSLQHLDVQGQHSQIPHGEANKLPFQRMAGNVGGI